MLKFNGSFVGLIGTRSRDEDDDFNLAFQKLLQVFKPGDILVSGGCGKGGDRFARQINYLYNADYLEFPANWKKDGKSAGYKRNIKIANFSDILIAIVDPASIYKGGDHSGGTEHTIKTWLGLGNEKSNLHII
jgi:hypothetical protein